MSLWRKGRDIIAADQARRDADQWDEENMIMGKANVYSVASPSDILPPSETQRIPIKLFDSYGKVPAGWIVRYSVQTGEKEYCAPGGSVWIMDEIDPRYLVMALGVIEPITKPKPEEEAKRFDRFEGLDI